MRIEQRVAKLEAKHQTPGAYYPSHSYIVTRGQESSDTRKDCPTCAAMSAEEYAAYREWWAGPGRKGITHVVIRQAAEVSPSQQSAEAEEE